MKKLNLPCEEKVTWISPEDYILLSLQTAVILMFKISITFKQIRIWETTALAHYTDHYFWMILNDFLIILVGSQVSPLSVALLYVRRVLDSCQCWYKLKMVVVALTLLLLLQYYYYITIVIIYFKCVNIIVILEWLRALCLLCR